jgi:hypothetical protein
MYLMANIKKISYPKFDKIYIMLEILNINI